MIPTMCDRPQIVYTLKGSSAERRIWFYWKDDNTAKEVAAWIEKRPNRFEPDRGTIA